jgi:hypothetical protein
MLIVKYNVFVIYNNNVDSICLNSLYVKSSSIYNMLEIPNDNMNVYVLNSNRRIVDIKKVENLESLDYMQLDKTNFAVQAPILLVENALSPELLAEVLQYYKDNINKTELHNSATKNRLHVHPNLELERKLDNKISRSVLPEVRKIFYFNVKHRELYKISSYDSVTAGKFHSHRDTQHPFQHRKYPMSLLLNDDYEGGEFILSEYGLKVKPKANTAVIFPGICSHEVAKVTKGSRQTIITFFCSELEGKTKGVPQYTMKSHFFDERNVEISQVFPFDETSKNY